MRRSELLRVVLLAMVTGALFAMPVAVSAQESVGVTVSVTPDTVSVDGEVVTFTVEVLVPPADLPATVNGLSSDVHGNLADATNPTISDTTCAVPVAYTPTGGFEGMACTYQVFVQGDPGVITNTVSATVVLADTSEVTVTGSASVTISDQLGEIRGTLIDADTGQPIAGVFVWGTCDGCGGFTGSDGVFIFIGVEPGDYRLRSGAASPGGWHPTSPEDYRTDYAYEWFDEEPVGPPGVPAAGTPVTVLAGETTEIQWELSRGGAIEGRLVLAASGQPLTDFEVLFWIVGSSGLASPEDIGGNLVRNTPTDGAFGISGLRAGNYIVCFQTQFGNTCWEDTPMTTIPPDGGDPVAVALGQTTTGIDAEIGAVGDGDGGGSVLPLTGGEAALLALLAGALLAGGLVLARPWLSTRKVASLE